MLTANDVGLGAFEGLTPAALPVSTATATEIDGAVTEANLYTDAKVAALVDASPGTLDTLNELAAALGDDPNFATTVATNIASKEAAITPGLVSQYWSGVKTWRDLATDVRAALLTGLSTATSTAVAATDTVLVAIGKLQAQASAVRSIALGGTGASDAAGARVALGVAQDGPRFRVYNSTGPALTDATITLVPLDSESFDPAGAFNNTTYRFQPAVAGYYDIKWSIGLTNTGATTLTDVLGLLYKNGAEYSRTLFTLPPSTALAGIQGGDVVYLNGSSDYLDLRVYGDISIGTLNIVGGSTKTWLAGHYIGA